MNRKSVIKVFLAISMVLLLAALPFVSACAPEEKPPEVAPARPEVAPAKPEVAPAKPEVKVVKCPFVTDLSGPLALTTLQVLDGMQDYDKWWNEEIGPKYGLEIDFKWADTGYVMSRVISSYKRFVEAGCPIVVACASPEGQILIPLANRDHIPVISAPGALTAAGEGGWNFAYIPTYTDLFGTWIDWFMAERWDKPYPPKLSWLTYDSAMGREPVKVGTWYAKEKHGIETVALEWMPYAPVDVTPQLLRIKEAGADIVYSNIIAACESVVLKDAMRLGLKDKMAFATSHCGLDPVLIELVGEAAEGCSAAIPWVLPVDEAPIMDLIAQWRGEDFVPPFMYLNGFIYIGEAYEAIRKAFVDEGYPVTGDAVRRALEGMKDFDMYGLGICAPISYGPEERRPYLSTQIGEISGGKLHNVTGWIPCPDLFWKYLELE